MSEVLIVDVRHWSVDLDSFEVEMLKPALRFQSEVILLVDGGRVRCIKSRNGMPEIENGNGFSLIRFANSISRAIHHG